MSTTATAADAELILRLYDLRRESVMREARKWIGSFSPASADDVLQVMRAVGTQENAYFRQVTSFWEMAASLVLHGTLNEALFIDNAGEMFFIFAKFYPFLTELRQKSGMNELLGKSETLINRCADGPERLKFFVQRIERMKQMREQAQAGKHV